MLVKCKACVNPLARVLKRERKGQGQSLQRSIPGPLASHLNKGELKLMKELVRILRIFGLVGLVSLGCAPASSTSLSSQGACAKSPFLGTWVLEGGPDSLSFNQDCTGSSSYCESTFVYPMVAASFGTLVVDVRSTSGKPGCIGVGEIACVYQFDAKRFGYDCGNGAVIYNKAP